MLPHDPFNRTRLPADFSREGRVELLAIAFAAMLEGHEVPRQAAMFLGSAGLAWLQQGGALGALERDYLQVAAPRRSTMTPSRLWQRAQGSTRRATTEHEPGTIQSS